MAAGKLVPMIEPRSWAYLLRVYRLKVNRNGKFGGQVKRVSQWNLVTWSEFRFWPIIFTPGTARIRRFCGPVGPPIWARCVRSRPAWRGQTLDRSADLGRFDEKLRRWGNNVELLARNLRTKGVALFLHRVPESLDELIPGTHWKYWKHYARLGRRIRDFDLTSG